MFCPKCGTPCTGQERFCSKCGATLNSSAAASAPSGDVAPAAPNAKKNVRPLFVILPCVLLVAIALTLFFVLRGGSGGSEEATGVDPFRDITIWGELDTDYISNSLGKGTKFETDYGQWGILYENFNYLGMVGNLEFYVVPSTIHPNTLMFYYYSSGNISNDYDSINYTATEEEKRISRKYFEKLSEHFTRLYGEPIASETTEDYDLNFDVPFSAYIRWCKAEHQTHAITDVEFITVTYTENEGYIQIECTVE